MIIFYEFTEMAELQLLCFGHMILRLNSKLETVKLTDFFLENQMT
jgi:hypothetical protein